MLQRAEEHSVVVGAGGLEEQRGGLKVAVQQGALVQLLESSKEASGDATWPRIMLTYSARGAVHCTSHIIRERRREARSGAGSAAGNSTGRL